MTDPWTILSFPGHRVYAVPNWDMPRLYLSARRPLEAWRKASLYPAFRAQARVYRFILMTWAAIGGNVGKTVPTEGPTLSDFLSDCLPGAVSSVIIVGPRGPTQKFTAVLWDACMNVIGYLKYGETSAARHRVLREFEILAVLPTEFGPRALKVGPLGNGVALLMTPVLGRHVPARLPPSKGVLSYLGALRGTGPRLSLDRHPWVKALSALPLAPRYIGGWLGSLEHDEWEVALQHGDFAPWNLVRNGDEIIRAVDWEYGELQGFPHIDLAYYVLQLAALIYRWSPSKALTWGVRYLSAWTPSRVGRPGAEALVRLAAFSAYHQALVDGHSSDMPLLRWRKAVWGSEP